MNKKLISVILPSRGRLQFLKTTLDSVITKCKNVENIEILVKVDDDDLTTIEGLKSYENKHLINVIVSGRQNGYESLNEFYNELYGKSSGEFIFCVNDDMTIITENWDELVKPFSNQFVCLHHNPCPPHNDTWYFPIISKEILDVIGCVSKSVFYDGYLFFMLEGLDVFNRIDLTINHLSLDDQLTLDKLNVIQKFKNSEWEFDTKKELMYSDRNKIIEYINERKK